MPYKDIEKYKAYRKKHNAEWCKKYRIKRREKILLYYGNGKIECSCCFESTLEFLSIDHINGGGTKQKKLENNRDIYNLIQREKKKTGEYPKEYRILCHNCNQSYGFYGYCPHQMRK